MCLLFFYFNFCHVHLIMSSSSITDLDINQTLSTKIMYHIPLIYSIDKGSYYYGSYHDKSMKITGIFQAKTREEMFNQCYESLAMSVESADHVPFDVNHIKSSVVFDEIKCKKHKQMNNAYAMEKAGKSFAEIIEAINK